MPPPGMNPYAAPLAQGSAMGPMYAPQSESSRAQWAIGLAIASWVLCGLLTSVPAVFMARSELSAIERGESSPGSKGLAQAAFWIAAANIGLTLLGILAAFVMFFAMRP